MTDKQPDQVHRFTSLPFLLDMLHRSSLTLVNPSNWEDRNDAFFLEQYKAKSGLKTVLALCFTTKPGRFHHWKIYAGSPSGVSIEFNTEGILKGLGGVKNTTTGNVDCPPIDRLENEPPDVSRLPFLKRRPFVEENEWRIIYQDADVARDTWEFDIDIACVREVTLSPWMPEPIANSVKEVIKRMDGCEHIKVHRSNLLDTDRWKRIAINCPGLPEKNQPHS